MLVNLCRNPRPRRSWMLRRRRLLPNPQRKKQLVNKDLNHQKPSQVQMMKGMKPTRMVSVASLMQRKTKKISARKQTARKKRTSMLNHTSRSKLWNLFSKLPLMRRSTLRN